MNDFAHEVSGAGSGRTTSLRARLKDAWVVEFSNFRWRLFLCALAARLLPEGRAGRVRASLVRAFGPHVGARTCVLGMPMIQSSSPGPMGDKLHIGSDCTIGTGVILEFGAPLRIGDRVSVGKRVVLLTTTHQIGPPEHRAGPPVRIPVVIGSDVTIGAEAIILPGVTIGEGATVLPNSVVNASVAPGVTVGGIPARALREV